MFHSVPLRIKLPKCGSSSFSLKQSKTFASESTCHFGRVNKNVSHVNNSQHWKYNSTNLVMRTANLPNSIFGKNYYHNSTFENVYISSILPGSTERNDSNSKSSPLWLIGALLSLFWWNNQDDQKSKSHSLLASVLEASAEEAVLQASHPTTKTHQYVHHIIRKEENMWFFHLRVFFRTFQLLLIYLPLVTLYPFTFIPSQKIKSAWRRLMLNTLEFCGPCFIKLGQWISTRPDLFSEDFCEAMSKLHNQCPTHSFRETREVIEKTLRQPIEAIFQSFDEVPLASGAIAQVHKATLKDGTEVAVKVRHPNSAPSVAIDLAILDTAARVISWLPRMEFLSLVDAVEQFSTSMSRQLNLFVEAQHLLRFRENFRDIQEIIFPKPFLQYSSKSVLVESFERGLPISKFFLTDKDIELNRKDPSKHPYPKINHILAQIGLNAYMKMMLLDFFVHADLHPGNILVQLPQEPQHNKKAPLPKLVFLDVGLVAEFTDADAQHFVELFKAIVKGDGVYGTELMIKYSKVPPKFKNKQQEEEFKQKMAALFTSVREKKLSQVDVGEFLGTVLGLMRTYRVTIEGSFATLVVGTVVLEGIGRRLDPDINLLELSVPFLFKAAPHAFLPWKLW